MKNVYIIIMVKIYVVNIFGYLNKINVITKIVNRSEYNVFLKSFKFVVPTYLRK